MEVLSLGAGLAEGSLYGNVAESNLYIAENVTHL